MCENEKTGVIKNTKNYTNLNDAEECRKNIRVSKNVATNNEGSTLVYSTGKAADE